MQTQIARDLKRALSKLSSDDNSPGNQSTSSQASKRIRTRTFKGNERFPEFTVGLDGPFMKELKSKLLHGDEQVLNLHGLAGSGKTTLAKILCHDPQVKDKFKDIFFETLGSQFRGNEAIDELQDRLPEFGGNPVLLVLDDVWPASKNVVEEFRVQISAGSKIFVTSRVPIITLGRYPMEQLSEDDAVALFLHFIQPSDIDFDDNEIRKIVLQIVKGCKRLPLALEFIGRELQDKGIEELQKVQLEWSRGQSILDSNSELLAHLQNSLNLLVDESIRECFMDLGLFPEDQKIPVSALIDIWTELYNLDELGICAMTIIRKLMDLNLAAGIKVRRIVRIRRVEDNYYNNHFLVQHDLFRELAIHISNQELFENRKRLIIDMNGNDHPQWWPQQNQQEGITAHALSYFTKWFKDPNQKCVSARILSISTDQDINPDWCNVQADDAIVLVLNLRTTKYTLPEFIKQMRNLRVLIVTNYGFRPSELKNLELLEFLRKLKRIRLEGVSVPPLCRLKNVCKLSLYMCEVKKAFETSSIEFSKAMPGLVELNIDYCKDLAKLPSGLCDTTTLRKLSISHCNEFNELPQEIGKLEKLELLRISYCPDIKDMPESITKLKNLSFLDITYCGSLRKLPDKIGELRSLRKFYMPSCAIMELPDSIKDMDNLQSVICDEYTYPFWEVIKYIHSGLNIKIAKTMDTVLDWLLDLSSRGLFH
ncbi:probable disease resistance protein At5g66890 [Neltuma alba]|nr:probable disease resistance protein At5g66890 [Prosopis alba]